MRSLESVMARRHRAGRYLTAGRLKGRVFDLILARTRTQYESQFDSATETQPQKVV